jgi:hypothetical protein
MRSLALAGIWAVAIGSAHALPVSMYSIDFEMEDDFVTPLVHGQSIYSTARPDNISPNIPFSSDTVLEFGNLFNVSSTIIGSDGHLGPAIFDSDPADTTSTTDPDLLVGLGNVLLLHRDNGPNHTINPTYGLVFNNPNDEADTDDRGSIVFDFLLPLVQPRSIDLIDVDNNVNITVVLTDNLGRERTYLVPANWTTDITDNPAGYQTLDLDSLLPQSAAPNATGLAAIALQDLGYNASHVVRLAVQFAGTSPSGAIDNLIFRVVPEPTTHLLVALAAGYALVGHERGDRGSLKGRQRAPLAG